MIDFTELVQQCMDGEVSPYKTLHLLKQQLAITKTQIEIVETEAFNQAQYEDKTFEKDGFSIEKRNGRANYNFKGCKSFLKVNDELEKVKSDLKANFTQWEKGNTVVDENSEILEVPTVTFAKDSMIVKPIK